MKRNRAIVTLLCVLLILAGVTYVDFFGVNAEGRQRFHHQAGA